MSAQHTLVLMQFNHNDTLSRTYTDFDSVQDALDGILQIFEQAQKRQDGAEPRSEISYELNEVNSFIDRMADFVCLVYQDTQKIYLPHGKDWIKSKLYMSLKREAAKNAPKTD